nr:hypothetical protein [uncultured Planococcus sp.]
MGRAQKFQRGTISWHPETGAHAIWGLINAKWQEIGRERYGYPITSELPTPDGKGRFNHFRSLHEPGKPEKSIYWHPETGAHQVFGAIRGRWAALGWEKGPLGYPVSAETPTFDNVGRMQRFQRGVISWHPETGAHAIWGEISAKWWGIGLEKFGYPITDELPTPDGKGRFNHFRSLHEPGKPEKSIYWHPETGAHQVFGAIRGRWAALGWEKGPLGYPVSAETPTFDNVGRMQRFQRGVISWHPETGAHAIWGEISAKWWGIGLEKFGYPITDELPTPDGQGRFNHFRSLHEPGKPEKSIYWYPNIGAQEVYGGIREHWKNLGWERSSLGYPISPERDRPGGGRMQDFQNGTIGWTLIRGPFVEVVRMHRRIITPSGVALGGWAELELRQDGHYTFRGHLHDSGFLDYQFQVRASIATNAGMALVVQKSGTVEGTESGLSPRRDFDWDERDHSKLIQLEWPTLQFGTLQIAKAYEYSGVVGGLESVVKDVVEFLVVNVALGPQAAIIHFIGKELGAITKANVVGVGGIPALLATAGASFLLSPTLAIPVFVGTLAATNALVKHRPMSVEEYAFANLVFKGTLPPRERIILTNLTGLGGRIFVAPNIDGGVLLNLGDEVFQNPMGTTRGSNYPTPGEVFIHELVHAWQLERDSFIPGWVCKGATSSEYTPKSGQAWNTMNIEQKATVVNLWYRAATIGETWTNLQKLEELLTRPKVLQNEYFHYVHNQIRAAQD